jgi:endonuclease-3
VGFWRRKAFYLRSTAQLLLKEHGGEVPSTIEALVRLPGVGMKMAQICMAVAHKVRRA